MSSAFDELVREHTAIPWDAAAHFLVELQRPTGPPSEPVKTASVQAGMLKIAAIVDSQTPEVAEQAVADEAMTDPNIQAALDYQQAMQEREHFAQVAQEAEQRAQMAEQQSMMAQQQAQEAAAQTQQASDQAMMEAQQKQQAMQEAIAAKDQSLQEQMLAADKRRELVEQGEDLKAQLEQAQATEEQQAMESQQTMEALRQGIEAYQQNAAVNPLAEQQQAEMQQAAMEEEAMAQQQGGVSDKTQDEQAEAQNAAMEAEQQAAQAQQAQAQDQAQMQAPPPPDPAGAQGAGPGQQPPQAAPQIPGAAMPNPTSLGGQAKMGSAVKDVARLIKNDPLKAGLTAGAILAPAIATGTIVHQSMNPTARRARAKKREQRRMAKAGSAKTTRPVRDSLKSAVEAFKDDPVALSAIGAIGLTPPAAAAYRAMKKSASDARAIGESLGVNWDRADFSPSDLARGIEVEKEHNVKGLDVVGKDTQRDAAKIALAHLREGGDYYDRLERMEADMKKSAGVLSSIGKATRSASGKEKQVSRLWQAVGDGGARPGEMLSDAFRRMKGQEDTVRGAAVLAIPTAAGGALLLGKGVKDERDRDKAYPGRKELKTEITKAQLMGTPFIMPMGNGFIASTGNAGQFEKAKTLNEARRRLDKDHGVKPYLGEQIVDKLKSLRGGKPKEAAGGVYAQSGVDTVSVPKRQDSGNDRVAASLRALMKAHHREGGYLDHIQGQMARKQMAEDRSYDEPVKTASPLRAALQYGGGALGGGAVGGAAGGLASGGDPRAIAAGAALGAGAGAGGVGVARHVVGKGNKAVMQRTLERAAKRQARSQQREFTAQTQALGRKADREALAARQRASGIETLDADDAAAFERQVLSDRRTAEAARNAQRQLEQRLSAASTPAAAPMTVGERGRAFVQDKLPGLGRVSERLRAAIGTPVGAAGRM